ncbi:hypothetical protein F4780DRAFT_779947 [Xylariomycetidae sp. FL0641]|nr:hypothetical protein F4780DRAFT_779947 [Xylariomycetidae sp. FL0641]
MATQQPPSLNTTPRAPESLQKVATGDASSPVILAVSTRAACYDPKLVTEVAYTMYDTRGPWAGSDVGQRRIYQGSSMPGDRGMNYRQKIFSYHYIVGDTADHHLGTCANLSHTQHPYGFAYRKSELIHRKDINRTLDSAFNEAATWRLSLSALNAGARRPVILLSLGLPSLSEKIRHTTWFQNGKLAAHWDLREHPVIKQYFQPLRPDTMRTIFRLIGLQFEVNGVDITRNSKNFLALMLQFFLAASYLSREQQESLTNRVALPPMPPGLGLQVTMARVNHPPGEAPLTDAPSTFTVPRRPQNDTYRRV